MIVKKNSNQLKSISGYSKNPRREHVTSVCEESVWQCLTSVIDFKKLNQ